MPHRSRINRLARLLLDIKIDFFLFFEVSAVSTSTCRRQSGIFARIEGVTLGSLLGFG